MTLLGRCGGVSPAHPPVAATTASPQLHHVDDDNVDSVNIVPASFAAYAAEATATKATSAASFSSGAAGADAMIGSGAAATGSHVGANETSAIR